jgi:hypothetical protein
VREFCAELGDGVVYTGALVERLVPFHGADLFQETPALRLVGNDFAIGPVAFPVHQHFSDIEDDVADFCGHALLAGFVAPGKAASMAFFMTLGKACSASEPARAHQ